MTDLHEALPIILDEEPTSTSFIGFALKPIDVPDPTPRLELTPEHKGLMLAVERSLGSVAYRRYFQVSSNGETVDLVEGGDRACAFYISRLLTSQGLLPCAHLRVNSTLACMEQSGWKLDEEPRIGNVVVWGALQTQHMGLVVGTDLYASNSSNQGGPIVHRQDSSDGSPTYFSHPRVVADFEYFNPSLILAEIRRE